MNLGPQVVGLSLAATEDDLSPTTHSIGSILAVTPASGGSSVTGFDSKLMSDGDAFYLVNSDDTDSITLKHQDSGSLAANRLTCPSGADVVVVPGGGVLVTYSSTEGFRVPLSNVAPTSAGEVANSDVSPAVIELGIPRVVCLTFADDAGDTTTEYINSTKIEIIDAWAIKDGAGTGNTIKVTDSADADITNAMAFAVDKTVTHAGTIDVAKRVLAAAAGFKVVRHDAAGSTAGQLFLLVVERA